LNLLGCIRRFLSAMSLHITSILLRQAWPGAPAAVTPCRLRRTRRFCAGPANGRSSAATGWRRLQCRVRRVIARRTLPVPCAHREPWCRSSWASPMRIPSGPRM
jgi:hypothetical protein